MNDVIKSLNSGDFGCCFEIPEKRATIVTEVREASNGCIPYEERVAADSGSFPLQLPNDEYKLDSNRTSQPEPFRVLLHKAAGRWWVYKQYERVDLLFKLENFRSKIQHLTTMPSELLAHGDLIAINDHLSVISVMCHEEDRKRELRGRFGGGVKQKLRTMRSRETPGTYMAAFARELEYQTPLIVPSLAMADHSKAFFEFVKGRLAALEKVAAAPGGVELIKGKIQAFLTENSSFVEKRRAMRDPGSMQAEINSLIPYRRATANDIILLKNATALDVISELYEYPPWAAGLHYCFLRVCRKTEFTLMSKDGLLAVKDEKSKRLLKVKPSRYTYGVQPSRIVGSRTIEENKAIPLQFLPPAKRAPSIWSESGASTISNMSTATTSPLSWCQDWSVQAPHEDYEHRLAESSIPNETQSRVLGEKEMLVRYNNEVAIRLNAMQSDMESLRDLVFLNMRIDPAVVFACEHERYPTALPKPGNKRWLKDVEKRLKVLCAPDALLTAEDKRDLEALAFAKTRYEPILRCYEKELQRNMEFKKLTKHRGEIVNDENKPKAVSDYNLAINEAWIRAVESGRIPIQTIDLLRAVISDHDSCKIDSDYSDLYLVIRADRLFKYKTTSLLTRLYLNDRHTAWLVYGAVAIIFIVLFLLFASHSIVNIPEPWASECIEPIINRENEDDNIWHVDEHTLYESFLQK